MDKANEGMGIQESLACGARTLTCFTYEDPATLERVGIKLFAQACLCPAAILAANVSLMEGESPGEQPHNIPFSDGLIIGPKGAMVYSSTCRSQLVCGPLCMGLPVLCMENLLHRQRIRDKYGLQRPSSFLEVGAGFCYPFSLFDTHTFLREQKYQQTIRRSGDNGAQGPLETAMRAMKRTARSKGNTAGQDSNSVAIEQAQPETLVDAGNEVPMQGALRNTAASGGVASSIPADSVGETPDQAFTPYGQGQTPNRRAQPAVPAASAESRSTPSSSIPPPEVTDSPHMRRGSPATSSTASRQDDAESALADSASFPVPAALPLPAMVRDPPTFAVPPSLKPPDSTDPEVMAAWTQGPKLTHLSQSLQEQPSPGKRARNPHDNDNKPKQAVLAPITSGSNGSLFSIALEPSDRHLSPAKHPNGAPAHGGKGAPVIVASSAATEAPLPTPGSSRDLQGAYDTISSSKLSVMIDQAMLNGSGSTCRGSGGANTVAPGSADTTTFWNGYRQSAMAPIAEADAEDSASPLVSNQTGRGAPHDDGSVAALGTSQEDLVGCDDATSIQCSEPLASRNAQRGLRSSGASGSSLSQGSTRAAPSVRTSGSAGSSGAVPVSGVNAVALTALARMGSDCGGSGGAVGTIGSRGSGPRTGNKQNALPVMQRRAAAPTINNTIRYTAGAGSSLRAAAAARAAEQKPGDVGMDDDVGTSADNFSNGGGMYQGKAPTSPAPPQQQYIPPRHVPTADAPCAFDDGDDEVNLASIRPSFIDAPELQHFKQVLRTAGEEAEGQPTSSKVTRPAATPPTYAANTVPAPAARFVSFAPAVGSLSQRGGGRYGSRPAIPPPAVFNQGCSPSMAAPNVSYCGDGPSQEDTGGSMSEEGSSAIDGPVSSADVSPASGGQRGHAGARRSSPKQGHPSSAGGDGTVSVAITPPGPLAPCAAREPEVTPSAACTSASKQSASGLSVAESNVAYESTADSVAMSQHRQKHWINWMAQSGASVGMSVAKSVRPGYGKPSRASKVPLDQSITYASVNHRTQRSPVVVEEDDGEGGAPVYERWG